MCRYDKQKICHSGSVWSYLWILWVFYSCTYNRTYSRAITYNTAIKSSPSATYKYCHASVYLAIKSLTLALDVSTSFKIHMRQIICVKIIQNCFVLMSRLGLLLAGVLFYTSRFKHWSLQVIISKDKTCYKMHVSILGFTMIWNRSPFRLSWPSWSWSYKGLLS